MCLCRERLTLSWKVEECKPLRVAREGAVVWSLAIRVDIAASVAAATSRIPRTRAFVISSETTGAHGAIGARPEVSVSVRPLQEGARRV